MLHTLATLQRLREVCAVWSHLNLSLREAFLAMASAMFRAATLLLVQHSSSGGLELVDGCMLGCAHHCAATSAIT